ncbi:conserved Plasmodium protein, unknown function [Plasmodium malariae]|uniref:Conserved oligomeric Golgi complex subunit 4 C-terminal domain-containing protein n=1 Tax=Plasmodium malariae TaxID=5858 RepID=A0A1D3SMY1_PLAMA|nr:conserved Plasmodium protein, unknown function [Plasmodium malariae]SCO93221.1 conserved Plasmodium protein, unknown function [Plasmodium malariae]
MPLDTNMQTHTSSTDTSEENESDMDEDVNKLNEYIEKLDLLNNSCELQIKMNQQKEKENFVNNIDDINIYIRKHISFKKKLDDINKSFKKNCNYEAFSRIEKVYKTISHINSSYEYITLKIKLDEYIEHIENNIKTNYLNTISYLNHFLEIRKNIYRYNSSSFLYSKDENYSNSNSNSKSNSNSNSNSKSKSKSNRNSNRNGNCNNEYWKFRSPEERIIENDIVDFVNYKRALIFHNFLSKKSDEHSQAYIQIYNMDREKINLLTRYYCNVKSLIEGEINECIKKKDIKSIKTKINTYLSLFQHKESSWSDLRNNNSNVSSVNKPNDKKSEGREVSWIGKREDGTEQHNHISNKGYSDNTNSHARIEKKERENDDIEKRYERYSGNSNRNRYNESYDDSFSSSKSESEHSGMSIRHKEKKNANEYAEKRRRRRRRRGKKGQMEEMKEGEEVEEEEQEQEQTQRQVEGREAEEPMTCNVDECMLYFEEYLYICYITITVVEMEVENVLDLLNKKVMSKEDNMYIECIKSTYKCLFKYNVFFEKLVHDNVIYIIYNRKIELLFNKVINVMFNRFFTQVKLSIQNFDELKNYDKNIEILSLLCYNFLSIKKYLHHLSFDKFQKINSLYDIKNYINTNIFSQETGLYKNLPYINLIQDTICSYIDHEVLFSKHCIDKAYILTDDIMLSLIDEKNKKEITLEDHFNFDDIINNNNEFTSTFLEDAFYIFQKSMCRSINMNEINTICVLINNIMIVLSTTLKNYLKENIKTSKNIYSSYIHDINNLKNFSFSSLLKSIDSNNYLEDNHSYKTLIIAQNFVSSLTYISGDHPSGIGSGNNNSGINNSGINNSGINNSGINSGSNNNSLGNLSRANSSKGAINLHNANNSANINNMGSKNTTSNNASSTNHKSMNNRSNDNSSGNNGGGSSGFSAGVEKAKDVYDYVTREHLQNLFNPLSDKKNMEGQIINSKFSYPHCINNLDACYQYIQKYKMFISNYFMEKFIENNNENKKEVQNYLLMFNNALANYDNLLKDYEKINMENCKTLLNILKIHFISQLVIIENINFDITHEQYSYYQLNDPYIQNLINRIKLILYHISLYYNQSIFHISINLLAEKICKYIERIIRTKKFSIYGCVQIDNDIRNLMLFFTSLTNINIKKEFSKLFEICELLNVSDIQDFKDFYDENKNNLNTSEIEGIISLRNDVSEELLKSIKLYMNLKMK